MKTLIIVANPNTDSFSFGIANKYKELALLKHHQVKMIDLYRDNNQQPFHYFINTEKEEVTKEMKYFQEKILWADELVFVFPVWWGSMPAILKNFFDWNFNSGFAFKYVNSRPKGLLTNKTVKVFTTAGTPTLIYTLSGAKRRLKNTFKKQIFEFCGMKLVEFNLLGGMNTKNVNTQKMLGRIK